MQTHTYDAFTSYNHADLPAVNAIVQRLRNEAGLRIFLDERDIVGGSQWMLDIENALYSSATCLIFYGPSGLGNWQDKEKQLALDFNTRNKNYRVILVKLPGVNHPPRGFITLHDWEDLSRWPYDEVAFRKLVNSIRGFAPLDDEHDKADDTDTVCPFRGLEPFEEEHARFFFGRTALTAELIDKLRRDRLLALIGPSGSGKSSLARAGIVHAIRQGALPGSEAWRVAVFKPGEQPLDALSLALGKAFVTADNPLAVLALRDRLASELHQDQPRLHSLLQGLLAGARDNHCALLVIDQFEEIFTLCASDDERRRFIGNLVHATSAIGARAIVVLTLRADFVAKCAHYPELAAALSGRDRIVGPMSGDELRQAVIEPAHTAQLNFETGLVDVMVKDLGHEPGHLPLLEDALQQLWERRQGKWLTFAAYERIGGVRRAIATRAESVYNALPPAQQPAAQWVLLQLVQTGEGTQDTRRRAKLADLLSGKPDKTEDDAALQTAVNTLAKARLITIGHDTFGGVTLDVAHEALIQEWPRLLAWVDADREALRLRRQLREALAEWQRTHDPSYFLIGARLQALDQLGGAWGSSFSPDEAEFLAASKRYDRRLSMNSRLRVLLLVSLIVALAMASLAGWAVYQSGQAQAARREANQAKQHSESFAQAIRPNALRDTDPLASKALAVDALASAQDTDVVLSATVQDPAGVVPMGQVMRLPGPVADLGSSPGDTVFVARYTDKPGEVRETATGRLLATLGGIVRDWLFSNNGQSLAVRYVDVPGEMRETATGKLLATLSGTLADWHFSSDGKSLIVGYTNRPGEVREAATGKLRATLGGIVKDWLVSDDGQSLAVRYVDVPGELRETATGKLLATLSGMPADWRFSDDSKMLLVSYIDKPGELREAATGKPRAILSGIVRSWFFHSDGKSFVVRYTGIPSELRETATGKLLATISGTLRDWLVSEDGKTLVIGFIEGPGEVHETTTGKLLAPLAGRVRNWELTQDGKSLIVSYLDKPGEVREMATGKLRVALSGIMTGWRFSADGRSLIVRYMDLPGEVRETATWTVLVPLSGVLIGWRSSDDGKSLVVSYADKPGEVRETATSKLLATLSGTLSNWRFSGDDRSLVVSYADKPGEIRETATWTVLKILSGTVSDWHFSADGKLFVVSYADKPGEVRETATGKLLSALSGTLSNWRVSADGKSLVISYIDQPSEVRETATGKLLATLSGSVNGWSVSKDGRLLLVWYESGATEVWAPEYHVRLATLGYGVLRDDSGKPKVQPDAHGQTLWVTYSDDRAYALDLVWLRAIQGGSALPGMSAQQIIALACQGPLSKSNPFFDKATQKRVEQELGRPFTACDHIGATR